MREPHKGSRTLRKALRRMLEHDWEHLAELSRCSGSLLHSFVALRAINLLA